jgi:predicted small lipoprotein YifL
MRPALPIALLAISLSGCGYRGPVPAAQTTAPTLSGDPAHPGQTSGWVDTKLYFGLGPADNPDKGVSEAQWRAFLDKEVTPRFPDGLSVVDVYGQWQGINQPAPERLRTKMVIVDYPDTQVNRDKIEGIRSAWKRLTGDQSVLRVTQPVDVSF